MSRLSDFLSHGVLPFVGRAREIERLLDFWRAIPRSQRMRAALILAEAGIGKSRLLEEILPVVADAGGAVIHAKLYPESATSIFPLLSRALWFSNVGRELLRSEPEPTRASVIVSLRRLARLRPTLLIVEDVHLLDDESIPEFAALMESLADETIALLCLGRPVEMRVRAVLEPYLVDSVELVGLEREEIDLLWRETFGSDCDPAVATLLHEATLGNPLALRSSLRTAIESGVIGPDRSGDRWGVRESGDALARLLNRSIGLLSEGMVSHLSREERGTAERLACLGEIFARETASIVLDGAEDAMQRLADKGIIATTNVVATPLGGISPSHHRVLSYYPASDHPLLTFSHTLLQKHLADHASIDPGPLLSAVARNMPLYSLTPLHRLARELDRLVGRTVEEMEEATRRLFCIALLLDRTTAWRSGVVVWELAERVLALKIDEMDEMLRRQWELRMFGNKLFILRRSLSWAERAEQIEVYLQMTSDPPTGPLAVYRLYALVDRIDMEVRHDYGKVEAVWAEIEGLTERFPEVRTASPYINCLAVLANIAGRKNDMVMLGRIEQRVREMAVSETIDEWMRRYVQARVYPEYLQLFTTREELAGRLALLDVLEGLADRNNTVFLMRKLNFLTHIGEMERVLAICDEELPRFHEIGNWQAIYFCTLRRLMGMAAFGTPLPEIAGALLRHLSESAYNRLPDVRMSMAEWTVAIGLLRGEVGWTVDTTRGVLPEDEPPSFGIAVMLAIYREDFAEVRRLVTPLDPYLDNRLPFLAFGALADLALAEGDGEIGPVLDAVQNALEPPILRIWHVILVGAIADSIGMVDRSRSASTLSDALRPSLHRALTACLEWLAEHSLFAFMIPIVERHASGVLAGDASRWRRRIEELSAGRSIPSIERPRRTAVSVSMVGTISVTVGGGEPLPVRGVRIRTLLGLMVADQMIGRSLTPREFVQLAGGGEEEDPELARKKRNMGVVRLREIMGADAILTDEKTPRLNSDLVEVDLIRADDLIKRALAAAREGALVRSEPLLLEALELTRGEVPFPTLYESFFEAARDDFEFRLRSAVIDVAKGLMSEGDMVRAEGILRRGYEAIPDDEDLAALLKSVLIRQGNRVEAERIRMRG